MSQLPLLKLNGEIQTLQQFKQSQRILVLRDQQLKSTEYVELIQK